MKQEIKKFYESTKMNFDSNESPLDENKWPVEWRKIFYKSYPRFPSKKLCLNTNFDKQLEDLLLNRKSNREFSDEPTSFEILSNITYFSLGIKEGYKNFDDSKRMYPSAGARYPIETYIICNDVQNLEKGLYHYNVKDNIFETLISEDLDYNPTLPNLSGSSSFPNAVFILTGVIPRSEGKYGNNSYRFALIECGHIGQNIYLLSEAMGIGCCAIGGFDNDKIKNLLDIGEEELPLYMLFIGNINHKDLNIRK